LAGNPGNLPEDAFALPPRMTEEAFVLHSTNGTVMPAQLRLPPGLNVDAFP